VPVLEPNAERYHEQMLPIASYPYRTTWKDVYVARREYVVVVVPVLVGVLVRDVVADPVVVERNVGETLRVALPLVDAAVDGEIAFVVVRVGVEAGERDVVFAGDAVRAADAEREAAVVAVESDVGSSALSPAAGVTPLVKPSEHGMSHADVVGTAYVRRPIVSLVGFASDAKTV
jgi:hypothetical protein